MAYLVSFEDKNYSEKDINNLLRHGDLEKIKIPHSPFFGEFSDTAIFYKRKDEELVVKFIVENMNYENLNEKKLNWLIKNEFPANFSKKLKQKI